MSDDRAGRRRGRPDTCMTSTIRHAKTSAARRPVAPSPSTRGARRAATPHPSIYRPSRADVHLRRRAVPSTPRRRPNRPPRRTGAPSGSVTRRELVVSYARPRTPKPRNGSQRLLRPLARCSLGADPSPVVERRNRRRAFARHAREGTGRRIRATAPADLGRPVVPAPPLGVRRRSIGDGTRFASELSRLSGPDDGARVGGRRAGQSGQRPGRP